MLSKQRIVDKYKLIKIIKLINISWNKKIKGHNYRTKKWIIPKSNNHGAYLQNRKSDKA